ncbi:c-type cytochrome [Magnetospirillum molischianum]|uniref:Cytochrome C n=1 Tax=Magnetospirillum molischianum DSM 120 TaxID=1150626 RepID=H8FWY0_MAGML|nr:c-type cytochrome [Magnetospirillum molischianum]CCG42868.1 Cytochrome C [Magnetospirillum molischianum DSM 120]
MFTFRKLGLAAAVALFAAPFAATAADAPPAFNQCKACHSVEAGKNGVGPSLAGVYGRKVGLAPNYKYSAVHLASGMTIDEAMLTKYLANPKETIPGNKMGAAFGGLKNPADVATVIAYLKTLK